MDRRSFLRVTGIAGAGASAFAGCLERLGFRSQSAWRDPPLVENRPDAVYRPAAAEEMGIYGIADDGEYAVGLSYTFPHRFWTVTGTETNRVVVEADDTMHLMVSVWDPETEHILPTDISLEVLDNGSAVESIVPWPMLSQRMGFHYGDNIVLPGEGEYTARVRVGPIQSRRLGHFADRFETASTLEIPFEYSRSDIHDLEFEVFDTERHGERDALPAMGHGGSNGDNGHSHDHDHGNGDNHTHTHDDEQDRDHDHTNAHDSPDHPLVSHSPDIDTLPGTHLGTERSGDADFAVIETDGEDQVGDTAIVVLPRTPYNRFVLPFMTLSITVERDGETLLEDSLEETLADRFGHHYRRSIDSLETGDELTITVDSPPGVSRHDGYETAFFDFADLTYVR